MDVLYTVLFTYWPYIAMGVQALAIIGLAALLLKRWNVNAAALKTGVTSSKKLLSGRLFTKTGFFYMTLFVFMLVSVGESGDFFNTAITHNSVSGLLGYAIAVGFDLLSYVCMVARLNAARIYDRRGVGLALLGVVVCASISAFANVASAIQGYNPTNYNKIPPWMDGIAPWSGVVFPAMIVIVSLIADHLGDGLMEGKSDAQAYRLKEGKKIELLRARLDVMKQTAMLNQQMAAEQAKLKWSTGLQREWFFTHWLRPVIPMNSEQITAIVAQTITPLQDTVSKLDAQINQSGAQNEESEGAQIGAQSEHSEQQNEQGELSSPRPMKNRQTPARPAGAQKTAQKSGGNIRLVTGKTGPMEAVRAQLAADKNVSDRKLGSLTGLSPATAKKYREMIEQENLSGQASQSGAQNTAQNDAQETA